VNKSKQRAIIFDLEGTLTDMQHREHLIPDKEQWGVCNTNWDEFHSLFLADKVKLPVAMLYTWLRKAFPILIFTGKPESGRSDVEEWMHMINLQKPELMFMRKDNDERYSELVKRDMLYKSRYLDWDPMLAVDDHPECIEMFQRNHILTLQVGGAIKWHSQTQT